MEREACLNCGAPAVRAYCPQCGQRHVPADQLDVRHLLLDYIEETLRELKPLNTLWGLMRRPGQQTVEYVAGQRKRQANPLLLYLFIVGITVTLAESQDFAGQIDELMERMVALYGALLPADIDIDDRPAQLPASWSEGMERAVRLITVLSVYLWPPMTLLVDAVMLRLLLGRDLLRSGVTLIHVSIFASLVAIPMMGAVQLFTSGEVQTVALLGLYVIYELVWLTYGVATVRRVYEVSWLRSGGALVVTGLVSRTVALGAQMVVGLLLAFAGLVWLAMSGLLRVDVILH